MDTNANPSSITVKNHKLHLSRCKSSRGKGEDRITTTAESFSLTLDTEEFVAAATGIILANMQLQRIESGEYAVKEYESVQLCKRRVNKKTFLIEYCDRNVTLSYNESLLSRFKPKEMTELTESIICFLNDMVGIEGFDIRNIYPIFLSECGSQFIPGMYGIQYDEVYLEDLNTMYMDKNGVTYRCWIKDSHLYKILSGLPEKNECPQINPLGQTDEERLSKVLESVKNNGYPYNNEYIILFNDELWIRDGRHRACCLLHLHGNIKVPVLRIKTKESGKDIENTVRNVIRYICKNELKDKKIAVKGGGIHTVKFLDTLGLDYDIRCIVDRKKSSQFSFPCEIISDDELKDYEIDVVVISSYLHRHEMRKDIERLGGPYKIFDIYDSLEDLHLELEEEFYNYYDKEIIWKEKW